MPPQFSVIKSQGIYHGLPTFPDKAEYKDLTAIVTGANGISGYHMVKALAGSPERWKKIYCLSRRPPQDYFYDGLGEGAERVEHVEADFLAKPQEIAESLEKKIKHVDHVFFFSYTQPQQKGGVLNMWSDADALAKINTDLISNFIEGLKLAKLTPKRFLLQTGAKHYGFHIGPATSPSYEFDPRVTLENNFYYPQEDVLAKYCKEQNLAWNVVRPSYIIGAVRDNILNYLPGFAVYASVQAHLKQPLAYPGDYVSWDREHCQSSAMINAYLEEWAVLTPAAANEAFNVQDGTPFTWGRFWPYLSSWYGASWSPPETDPEKYRSFTSRATETPRGYGSQGVTRSTFSLMEWSEKPEVVQAWEELKAKHGLLLDPFKDRAQTFGVTDSAIIGGWPLSLSIRKARKMGFHGTADSIETQYYTFQALVDMKMSPPLAVDKFVEDVQ